MPDLPVEIVGKIIEDLWEDKHTLKATSLLCRDIQSVAQRILFHRIELVVPDRNNTLDPRLHGFLSSPRITSYIQEFHIWVKYPNIDSWQTLWVANFGDVISRLFRMLLALNKLRQFEVYGDSFTLSPDIAAICEGCTSLRTLYIDNHTYFPLHRCGPWLTHIGMNKPLSRMPAPHNDVFEHPMSRSTPIVLESLGWWGTGFADDSFWDKDVMMPCDYILDPRSLIDLSCLKRLEFQCLMGFDIDVDFRYLGKILELCQGTLESFGFTFRAPYREWPSHFTLDLHTFSNLKELSIEADAQPVDNEGDFFVWLSKKFTMPAHPFRRLEGASFRVNFRFQDLRSKDFLAWESLSRALANREHCPNLQSVEFAVAQLRSGTWARNSWLNAVDINSIEETIERAMDPLSERGILKPIQFNWYWQRDLPVLMLDVGVF